MANKMFCFRKIGSTFSVSGKSCYTYDSKHS